MSRLRYVSRLHRWIWLGTLLILLTACAQPTFGEHSLLSSATLSPTSVSATPTVAPPVTTTPRPTRRTVATPTPAPTVSLGFLTAPTATLTATVTPISVVPTATPYPVQWLLPSHALPEPFGVNIHFTDPEPGEMAMLAAGGFRFVRMDLFWHKIEREIPGRYDFSAYDRLVAAMAQHDIRIIFILDYGNDLYGGGNAHHFEEGRTAFVRFATAAAERYRGEGIVWEIWNEPNLEKYWHGPPDPLNYADLAFKVIAGIRSVDPTALIVGPATAGFPWEYLETLADVGLFNKLDAVTVHPYRFDAPESAWEDYARLRGILDRVSPERKIPVIAGEWGYSTVINGPTEELQAQYVVRQWLSHLAADVDLSIWYDWRNDGPNRAEIEHNFGLVTEDLRPKLAYEAAVTLNETLTGYAFQRRLPLANPDDYVLFFRRGDRVALAAWTTQDEPRTVQLPIFCETVESVTMLGGREIVQAPADGVELPLAASPRYVRLCISEAVTRMGLWRPVGTIHVLSSAGEGRVLVAVDNPFYETVQAELQLWVAGEPAGSAWVQAGPHAETLVSVPVTVPPEEAASLVPAVVRFVTPDTLPLQDAAIWLHLPPTSE